MNGTTRRVLAGFAAALLTASPAALQAAEGEALPVTPVADSAALMPKHGTVSLYPAKQWEDSLATGNGRMGALLAGDPWHETLIVDHCKMWLPLGSREVLPDVGKYLSQMRRIIAEKGYGPYQDFFEAKAKQQGWGGKIILDRPLSSGLLRQHRPGRQRLHHGLRPRRGFFHGRGLGPMENGRRRVLASCLRLPAG